MAAIDRLSLRGEVAGDIEQDAAAAEFVGSVNGGIDIDIAGSGDFAAAKVNGPVKVDIAGAGNGALLRPAAALASFDKAIQLEPASADAHINRGNALQELNRLDEAVARVR